MPEAENFDVVIVGGGPAGAVLAWSLASNKVRVAVVERARFPREKVCGDFIEPGGLRILDQMGCLPAVMAAGPTSITHVRTFVNGETTSHGPIAYYDHHSARNLPSHGLIVPRAEFDTCLLNHAQAASATVFQGTSAKSIERTGTKFEVQASQGDRQLSLTAPLLVGADGAESLVARSQGLSRSDPRYQSISQRAYVSGVAGAGGEAALWFDADIFPGYAWMFPMGDGRANVGVGVLGEASRRHNMSVPQLFRTFLDKLRSHHHGCRQIALASRPMGGIVKSYAGIDRNSFDGGLLIGDAGSFVDPVTSEGITPGMESALIASRTILKALRTNRFDRNMMSEFEADYRHHFDPSMRYLDWCATLMSNRHMHEFCLRGMATAYREAMHDRQFARVAGASFGGLEIRPTAAMAQVFSKIGNHMASGTSDWLISLVSGGGTSTEFTRDIKAWRSGMSASMRADPRWHWEWTARIARKSARLKITGQNPRIEGVPMITP